MGVAFLGSYLCISILEFKERKRKIGKIYGRIYVFLYQNLKKRGLTSVSFNISFMYFYIRIYSSLLNEHEALSYKIYVFLYQNLKKAAAICKALYFFNLCISILEFKEKI